MRHIPNRSNSTGLNDTKLGTLYLLAALIVTNPSYAQTFETAFSPHGGGAALIVKQIDGAKKTIDLTAYQLTSLRITRSLCMAAKRGVKVRVYADRSQTGNKTTTHLKGCGAQVKYDNHPDRSRIAHNKYLLLDGKDVETGSFNYSERAEERNTENILVIHDAPFFQAYQQDFNKLWEGKK